MKKVYEFISPTCEGPLKVVFVAEEEDILKNIRFQSKEDTLVVLSDDQEVVNAYIECAKGQYMLQ